MKQKVKDLIVNFLLLMLVLGVFVFLVGMVIESKDVSAIGLMMLSSFFFVFIFE